MSETEYWFARRFPVGHPRNAMAPISRKALRVVYVFVGGMVLGALIFAVLAFYGQIIAGAVIYVLIAAASGTYFVLAAVRRGDPHHTVDDYKAGRVPGQKPYLAR